MSEANHYIDTSTEETEDREPISNPGVKLSPNEHSQFYDDVPGMSGAQPVPEKPNSPRPLPRSVRRLCVHPGDADYDGLLASQDSW
jgi:hypothetical protein